VFGPVPGGESADRRPGCVAERPEYSRYAGGVPGISGIMRPVDRSV